MKIIDLLNKIAKGEEVPKKIKWRNEIYKYNGRWEDYKKEVDEVYFFQTILNRNCNMLLILNDEVEIIEEEKEIEKLIYSNLTSHTDDMKEVFNKVNQIIDVINDMRDKEC